MRIKRFRSHAVTVHMPCAIDERGLSEACTLKHSRRYILCMIEHAVFCGSIQFVTQTADGLFTLHFIICLCFVERYKILLEQFK